MPVPKKEGREPTRRSHRPRLEPTTFGKQSRRLPLTSLEQLFSVLDSKAKNRPAHQKRDTTRDYACRATVRFTVTIPGTADIPPTAAPTAPHTMANAPSSPAWVAALAAASAASLLFWIACSLACSSLFFASC